MSTMILYFSLLLCLFPLVSLEYSTETPVTTDVLNLVADEDLSDDVDSGSADDHPIATGHHEADASHVNRTELKLLKNDIALPIINYSESSQFLKNTTEPSEALATSANTIIPILISTNLESTDPISSNQNLNNSVVAHARSFEVDSYDKDDVEDVTVAPLTTSSLPTTKPHKVRKKVLASRPKSSTEKLFTEKDVQNTTKVYESKDLTEEVGTELNGFFKISKAGSLAKSSGTTRSEDVQFRSFKFPEAFKMSTTSNSPLTVGDIPKVLNNNLLNVIDTTLRPFDDGVTMPFRDSSRTRNTIKFAADDFGSTGQSDWVPLVSDRGSNEEWSPIAGFRKTTLPSVLSKFDTSTPSEAKKAFVPHSSKRPQTSTMQTIVVQEITETPEKVSSKEGSSEMGLDLPPGSASWALASSHFTRGSDNATEAPKKSSSPIILALNNTLQRKIKENLLTLVEPTTTELSKTENATKDHNQVLKNTIPDIVFPDTTPPAKWKPVVTTTSPKPTTQPSTGTSEVTLDSDTISNNNAFTEVEKTMAYEIMKIATSSPTREVRRPTTQPTVAFESTLPEVVTESFGVSQSPLLLSAETTTEPTVNESSAMSQRNESSTGKTFPTFTPTLVSEISTESMEAVKSNAPANNVAVANATSDDTATTMASIMDTTTTSTIQTHIPTNASPVILNSTKGTLSTSSSSVPFSTTPSTYSVSFSTIPSTTTSSYTSTVNSLISSEDDVTTGLPFVPTFEESTFASTTPRRTARPFFTTAPSLATQTTTMPPIKITDNSSSPTDSPTLVVPAETTTFGIEDSTEDSRTSDDNRTILSNSTYEKDGISEENVPAYLRLTVQTSEIELCHLLPELRAAILKMLSEGTNANVSSESLALLNLTPQLCKPVLQDARPEDAAVRLRPVNMFLMDDAGDFNKNLSEAFLSLWGHAGLDFPLPILKVDFVTPIVGGEMSGGVGSGVVAAIAISCVAGICLILLGILFVIMKRRQKKFNYGQRCTPVSLDAYSLDSVSIRNSGRRKGIRASKRSYGNAAFDDPEIPSHVLNFAGLAKFTMEKDQIHEEFSVIPQVSPRVDEYPPGVETKNRYANVIPLPETRVILAAKEGDQISDYINANYVRGLNNMERTYIAAQAPLESTLADWWRMVWEQQVKVILMLTALSENGVDKCADYMPPSEVTDSIRLFGDFQVTLKKRDVKEKYIVSTLQLKNMDTNLWREVTQLWYLGWPDSGVPSEPNSLIAFLIEARSQIKTTCGSPAPTLVHCSPGTGRTGTVIACDVCIREFEQNRVVDIPKCVYHLRRARAGAVQTRDQYAFIYLVLHTYATKLTGGALETI